jgi:hypothetical protein
MSTEIFALVPDSELYPVAALRRRVFQVLQ